MRKSSERCLDESILGWHGQVEHVEGNRFIKKVYNSTAKGKRIRGRLEKGWIDSAREMIRVTDISNKDAGGMIGDWI